MNADVELEFRRDGLDSHAMNNLHAQVQGLIETIRCNEGLRTTVVRSDDDQVMRLGIGISDHEQKQAILQGVASKAKMLETRLKQDKVASCVRRQGMDKQMVAREILKAARDLAGGGWGRFSGDLADVLQAQVYGKKGKSSRELFRVIKSRPEIVKMMKEEGMTDRDLMEFLEDNFTQFIKNR
jgi:hypothetical protein